MRQTTKPLFGNLFFHASSISEYKVLLQNTLLLRFVIADTISFLGNRITYFALLKKGYEISGGNIVDLGLLTIAQTLPFILFGPFGGVLADRISRRRIMIISDLCNGIAILTFIFIRNLEAILIVAFLASSFYTFRNPAQKAFEPNLVMKSEIPLLNSFKSFINGFVTIVSSTLGAVIITFSSITACFIIDAATFIISAVIIATIRVNEHHLEDTGNSISLTQTKPHKYIFNQFKNDIKTSVALIHHNASLKLLLVLEMSISFLFGMQVMLFYFFVHETLHFGDKAELAWGVLMSNISIGSIIGSIIIGLMMKYYPNRFKLFLNILLFDGSIRVIFSLNTFFPFSILLSILLGIICAAPLIILTTILQESVTDENRGKVSSFIGILDNPMAILSVFFGMATAKLITAQGTLFILAVLEITVAIVALFSKTYRGIDQQAEKTVLFQKIAGTITA